MKRIAKKNRAYPISVWMTVMMALVYIFLYAPLIIMVVFSFNKGSGTTVFEGFSVKWYGELFSGRGSSGEYLSALRNSLLLAVLSAVISTFLGTLAALGIYRLRSKRLSEAFLGINNIPMMNPDIVTGVSMMMLFVFVGTLIGSTADKVNFWTLLIAHITFSLPYVILNVMPKLSQMDPDLTEAALDLGCTPTQAFFKVVLHEIMPGILSGALMAFTMSLDDFVISYFVTGSGFVTLPVEIYSYTKKPIQPKVYALFTLIFVAILLLMVTMNLLQARDSSKKLRRKGGNK